MNVCEKVENYKLNNNISIKVTLAATDLRIIIENKME